MSLPGPGDYQPNANQHEPPDCGWCPRQTDPPNNRDGWPLCPRCQQLDGLNVHGNDAPEIFRRLIEAEDERDRLRNALRSIEAGRRCHTMEELNS